MGLIVTGPWIVINDAFRESELFSPNNINPPHVKKLNIEIHLALRNDNEELKVQSLFKTEFNRQAF